MNDPLKDLNQRFKWTVDKREGWRVLNSALGPLFGDCDDYAITALWLMSEKSWKVFWWKLLSLQAVIWLCRTNRGDLHASLYLRKHGWIDSSYQYWSKEPKHTLLAPFLVPHVVIKLLMGKIRS